MSSTSYADIRTRRGQRGTQVLEFALVLPFLILLIMIILEAGAFVRAHQVISNAAREAAHLASLYQGRDYIETSHRNALGAAAACLYLNQHKSYFPGWGGDTNCGEPFTIEVRNVVATDPEAITVDGVNMPSTLAVITYRYQMKYLSLSLIGSNYTTLSLRGHAQFRNFY
jgi:Flp pilus assembly protein TadG